MTVRNQFMHEIFLMNCRVCGTMVLILQCCWLPSMSQKQGELQVQNLSTDILVHSGPPPPPNYVSIHTQSCIHKIES